MERANLKVTRGDNKSYCLVITDNEGGAYNITGWTVFFTVKENPKDTDDDAKIKKDVTSHTDATAGKTQINLSSTDTDLDIGTYYYDIQFKKSDGKIITPIFGQFKVEKDITIRTS